jgi:hypothetical protein
MSNLRGKKTGMLKRKYPRERINSRLKIYKFYLRVELFGIDDY